jgi:hypothetical protein
VIKSTLRSAAQIQARISTTQNGFRTPLDDLLLTEGGGVRNGFPPLAGPLLYMASIYSPKVLSPSAI